MAITASVSSKELINTVKIRHTGSTEQFSAALVNTATAYVPGSTVTYAFMAAEIDEGLGGYTRPTFQYINTDIGTYADDGVPLARKAVTFSHDDSTSSYDFSHVVLLREISFYGSINSSTLTVNSAFPNSDPSPSRNELDIGMVITSASLPAGIGITSLITGTGGSGTYGLNQTFTTAISAEEMTASEIVAVAPLASTATMSDGNEAVFYFDLKYFNYYQV